MQLCNLKGLTDSQSVRLEEVNLYQGTNNYAEPCELITDNSLWKHILRLFLYHSII